MSEKRELVKIIGWEKYREELIKIRGEATVRMIPMERVHKADCLLNEDDEDTLLEYDEIGVEIECDCGWAELEDK